MACDNCVNCTCKSKFYVKSRSIDGSHKLFESESKEDCIAFMRKWTGENAAEIGLGEMVTVFGDVVYVDNISPAKEESWNIRECWDYDEVIEHFCKSICMDCRFHENHKCLIKKVFNKLT